MSGDFKLKVFNNINPVTSTVNFKIVATVELDQFAEALIFFEPLFPSVFRQTILTKIR
jgi:hypothetical protein